MPPPLVGHAPFAPPQPPLWHALSSRLAQTSFYAAATFPPLRRGLPFGPASPSYSSSTCGMNLAFDRELIGPPIYFGLMGDGQPIGRYDDMWPTGASR